MADIQDVPDAQINGPCVEHDHSIGGFGRKLHLYSGHAAKSGHVSFSQVDGITLFGMRHHKVALCDFSRLVQAGLGFQSAGISRLCRDDRFTAVSHNGMEVSSAGP